MCADAIEDRLDEVRALMTRTVGQTSVAPTMGSWNGLMGSGKMLRARMAFRLGPALGTPGETLCHAAAAVELVHVASLLHDDVIDGGHLRRGAPTFWKERGIPGAILLGDLMLFTALNLVSKFEGGRLTQDLIRATGDVCDAETEQELILRGQVPDWDKCVSIAQRKTGALFAFVASVCGHDDEKAREALYTAGSKIGTAYQLADDILDATGSVEDAGKSLGSDEARSKTTAFTAMQRNGADPVSSIEQLCREAEEVLQPWPELQEAWKVYVSADLRPALDSNLARFREFSLSAASDQDS